MTEIKYLIIKPEDYQEALDACEKMAKELEAAKQRVKELEAELEEAKWTIGALEK